MTTLDFIAQYPWISFFLSWPTFLSLATLSWAAAATLENGMNLVLRIATLVSNTIVLLCRGYAPQSIEAAAGAAKVVPTESEDGQG